jgi:hypothetical protein
MLTGFDDRRGDMRSFYREDIERYLDISFNERAATPQSRSDVPPPAYRSLSQNQRHA